MSLPTIYILEQKLEKNVYPCKLQFYYIKVWCKGVYITRTCYHNADAGNLRLPKSFTKILKTSLFDLMLYVQVKLGLSFILTTFFPGQALPSR